MFHWGLEWSLAARKEFAAEIAKGQWPSDWFDVVANNDGPRIFYAKFINHCLATIESVLDGIGLFVTDQIRVEQNKTA